MKKILILTLFALGFFEGSAQSWTTVNGRQRFVSGLGIPVRDTSTATAADSAQIVIRPQDGKVYYRYKSGWRVVGITNISWDSVTNKPTNFSTTYALSNDIRDSIQARVVIKDNADYRIVTGTPNMNQLKAQSKLNFFPDSGIMMISAEPSTGYGAEIDFDNTSVNGTQWGLYGGSSSLNGMVLYRYLPTQVELAYWDIDRYALRSDVKMAWSSTLLSFQTPDIALSREGAGLLQVNNGTTNSYADLKLRNLTLTGTATGTSMTMTNDITANTFIKATGTSSQIMLADGSVLDKTNLYTGEATFDTTGRVLTLPKVGGGSTSVVIPRGTSSGAEGITALSSSRSGNLLTIAGDNGSTTTISIRDADSASLVRFSDTASIVSGYTRLTRFTDSLAAVQTRINGKISFADSSTILAGRWLPNRNEDTTAVLRALINTKGTGTVTSVAAGTGMNFSTITGTGTVNADTTVLSTKANVTGALVGYTTTGRFLDSLTNVQARIQTKQPLGNYITFADSSTILAGRWLPNRSADSIAAIRALANTKGVGTVTSVAASAGTGISISGSPITSSGTITITNTAPDQTVTLTAGTGISVSGTYPNFTVTNSSPSSGGTVTSVGLSAPTGFSVSNSPVTGSGTLGLSFAAGYSLPTDASQTNWNTAFNKRLASASFSASQLTLTLADATTVTTSVPTFNQNTTGTARSLTEVLSNTLGGAGSVNGIMKANGSGTVSAAVAGTDFVAPSALNDYVTIGTTQTINGAKTFASSLNGVTGIFSGSLTSNNSTTSASLASPSFKGAGEIISTGSSAGVFWENRSGGVTGTSNWYGWYTSSNVVRLFNGSDDILEINGTSGNMTLDGTLSGTTAAFSGVEVTNSGATASYFAASNGSTTSGDILIGANAGGDLNIFNPNATPIRFFTSGAEYMRITSGGNVGIGTTTPTYKFEVSGGTDYQQFRAVHTSHVLAMLESTTAARQALVGFKSPTREYSMGLQTDGSFSLFDNTASEARLSVSTAGAISGNGATTAAGVGAQSFRNKNEIIATGSFAGVFWEDRVLTVSSGANWYGWYATSGTSHLYNGTSNIVSITNAGAITAASSVTATGFFESSDIRLKNVMFRTKSADKIDVIQWKWKNSEKNAFQNIGYSAQDVQKVLPEAVEKDEAGYLKVNYNFVHTYKIMMLEKRIEELENRMK